MLLHISSLVLSVAVKSTNTFRVFNVIFEWLPLMIGGIEHTVRLESKMMGYTGDSRMIGKYRDIWRSRYFGISFLHLRLIGEQPTS